MLKRLLDKRIHVNNREDFMDTALRCACYRRSIGTIQMLIAWCRGSPLKDRLLPGLGHGLVALVQGDIGGQVTSSRTQNLMQIMRDSQLKISTEKFCETYSLVIGPNYRDWGMVSQQILLGWGVERCCYDEVFANELNFVPLGSTDDQQRLDQHLRQRESLKPRTTSSHATMHLN